MARPKKLPTVLTENEQERLLEQANPRYPTGECNQTMLRLILNTGLRLAEVTALKWRDLDLTTGKLMVRQGKGHKDRTLWVAEADIDRLRSLRERQAKEAGKCEQRVHHLSRQAFGPPIRAEDGSAICEEGRNREGYHAPHTQALVRNRPLPGNK